MPGRNGNGRRPGKGLETTGETTGKAVEVYKIQQPHGGSINSGGTPGNKGGRPPAAIKRTARNMLDRRLPVINKMVGSTKLEPSVRIAAFRELARIGMDPGIGVEDVRAALLETAKEIHRFPGLTTDQANELIARIEQHWLRL